MNFSENIKWYKKIFHLIDLAIQCLLLLFKMRNLLNPSFSDFKLQLIESIIEKYDSKCKSIIGRHRI